MIEVDFGDGPVRCRVVESFGYVHDVGMYAKAVEHPATGEERKVVKRGGRWVPWAADDKRRALIADLALAARRKETPDA